VFLHAKVGITAKPFFENKFQQNTSPETRQYLVIADDPLVTFGRLRQASNTFGQLIYEEIIYLRRNQGNYAAVIGWCGCKSFYQAQSELLHPHHPMTAA
jgi:hypothetical protein